MAKHILAIETSNPSAWTPLSPVRPGVAVLTHGLDLLARADIDPEAAHEDQLMSAVADAVAKASLTPRDLGIVAVSTGPGGYTAVRVAVTVAKFIAEATGAACVGVPTARVAALAVPKGRPFAVALASKRDTAYVTRFNHDAAPVEPGDLRDASWLEGAGIGLLVADRFLPDTFKATAARLGISLVEPVLDAANVARAGATLEPVDPTRLEAFYPREPEAVTKWRELHR
jgi:tRNA threonylcarbamoyl adenosine modification protein YeaZ